MRRLAFAIFFAVAAQAIAALDPASVRAAAAYSAAHGGVSLLVRQNEKTLYESGAETPRKIYSGTKAFWCLAALAAAQDGLLDLDQRVTETIPSWRGDARKARVTIRQLLDFSCGLEPGFHLHNDGLADRDTMALRLPMATDPGAAFIYGPSALQVFHAVLKAKLQGETPRHYLEHRVLHRIGLGSQRYLLDRDGNPLLAAGWVLSARDWARLGELALNEGAPMLTADSFGQIRRGSSANRAYSLGWWNNRAAPDGREFDFEAMLAPKWSSQNWSRACICRDAPSDLVMCVGSLQQRLYVLPSIRAVIVRHGKGGTFSDAAFLRLILGRER